MRGASGCGNRSCGLLSVLACGWWLQLYNASEPRIKAIL